MTSDAPTQLRCPQTVLWRSDGVLQIGLTDPVLLEGAPADAASLVELLAAPHTRGQLAARTPQLTDEQRDAVLEQLRRAGLLTTPAIPPGDVLVWGTGALAQRLAAGLRAVAIPTSPLRPEGLSSLDPTRLVVVATDQAEPDRAVTTLLHRAGVPHLIVRLEAGRAIVGPFVLPGETSCVHCLDLLWCGLDRQWPRLLAQLCAQRPTSAPLLLEWAIATSIVQVASWRTGHQPEARARTLELGLHDLRLRARVIPEHPECGCLST